MSQAVSSLLPVPAKSSRRPAVDFWTVFAWLAIQAVALLAAGFRIPFSARFPSPEELLAMHEMLFVQIVASALLFPVLLRNLGTAVFVITAAPLMMLLAGVMAGESDKSKLILGSLYPMLWLIGLAIWAFALQTPKARLYGVSVATLLAVGGAMLAYLDREFGAPTQTYDWATHSYLGPLVGGISLLESATTGTGAIWAFMGTFLLCGIAAASMKWAFWRESPRAV
jgi:hypothetical protein